MKTLSDIQIYIGHFGSGKTESALNHAINSSKSGRETVLIDIDIINPFFRSSEAKEILDAYKIELISPNYVFSTMNVPSLPPTIQGVFSRKNATIIFDVGGDEDGAKVLSSYHDYFKQSNYQMNFVLNTRRPFTRTASESIQMIRKIEAQSRLEVTHLISNTNLAYETSMDVVMEGISITKEIEKLTGIPLKAINIDKRLEKDFPERYASWKNEIDLFMAVNDRMN